MQANYNDVQMVLICGNYGAGKSSLAHKHFSEWKRVNRNEIRRFLKTMAEHGAQWTPDDFTPEEEHLVKHIEMTLIRYYLGRGEKVIVDNTSLSRKSRAAYLREASNNGVTAGCIFIRCEVSTLLERNRNRPNTERLPETIISQLYAGTEEPEKKEGFRIVSILDG